jgi:hypothetical protein
LFYYLRYAYKSTSEKGSVLFLVIVDKKEAALPTLILVPLLMAFGRGYPA